MNNGISWRGTGDMYVKESVLDQNQKVNMQTVENTAQNVIVSSLRLNCFAAAAAPLFEGKHADGLAL